MKNIGCVVAFSGGVESTALLEYLKDHYVNIVALYSHFPIDKKDGFDKTTMQASTVPEHLKTICDILDVNLVVHTHQKYDIEYQQNKNYFYSTRHWLLAMCNASIRFTNVSNFFWGANSGMFEYNDGYGDSSIVDPTKYEVQNIFDSFQKIPRTMEKYGKHRGTEDFKNRNYRNTDGSYKEQIYFNRQTISAPLIGLTKKQQWDSIRGDVQELVQSCATFNRCGVCSKCQEFYTLFTGKY